MRWNGSAYPWGLICDKCGWITGDHAAWCPKH